MKRRCVTVYVRSTTDLAEAERQRSRRRRQRASAAGARRLGLLEPVEAELLPELQDDQVHPAHPPSDDAVSAAYESRAPQRPHPHQLQQLSVGRSLPMTLYTLGCKSLVASVEIL